MTSPTHSLSRLALAAQAVAASLLCTAVLPAQAALNLLPGQSYQVTRYGSTDAVGFSGGAIAMLGPQNPLLFDINGNVTVNLNGQTPLTEFGLRVGGHFFAYSPDALSAYDNVWGNTDIANGYLFVSSSYGTALVVTSQGGHVVQHDQGGLELDYFVGGGGCANCTASAPIVSFVNNGSGLYEVQNDLPIVFNTDLAGPSAAFSNTLYATFSKTAGLETDVLVPFYNAGLVNSSHGILFLGGGGQHDGGSFQSSGSGAIYFGGTHQLSNQVTLGQGSFVVTGRTGDSIKLNPGAWLEQQGQLTNYGLVDYSNGSLHIAAGATLLNSHNISSSSGGQIIVSGTLSNSGMLQDHNLGTSLLQVDGQLINRSGGNVTLWGLMLHNGSIQTDAGSTLVIIGHAQSAAGSSFANAGSTTVAGVWNQNGSLVNSGTFSVGPAMVDLNGTPWPVANGTTISGTSQITNSGSFAIAAGAHVTATTFTQTAGLLTVDGTLDTGVGVTTTLLGGTLNGNGVINGWLFVGGGPGTASFKPGHSPGTFTINGALVLGANGELELQVERAPDGTLAWDHVNASSISFLAGSSVHFIVGDGVAGSNALNLSFLNCGSGCSFDSHVSYVIDGAPGATVQFGAGGIELSIAAVQAVPEPAAFWLMLVGVGLLCSKRRAAPAL